MPYRSALKHDMSSFFASYSREIRDVVDVRLRALRDHSRVAAHWCIPHANVMLSSLSVTPLL